MRDHKKVDMNTVITGASKGIGKAIAEKFAAKGSNLLLCSRNLIELEALKSELIGLNPAIKVFCFQADLSKKDEVTEFGKFCLESVESIDLLVNNAGVYIGGQIIDEEEGALEAMINTNLYSAYYLTRKLIPKMIEQKSGTIVNMASVASMFAYPNGGSYSISKFALRGFSMGLREELKPHGIKVTTILPGATWSNSWSGVDLPEDRLMQASDIAEAIWSIFEMSPAAVIEEIIMRPQLGDL